jgi:RNA polymerase sigma-70 factor (ECF subfamily)
MTAGEVQRDEKELVVRARTGDREAFAELIWRHQDAVYTLAHRLVGPDLAPDVTQEVLIRAWRSIGGFRGEASFATWLHRITVNTAWTQRRRAARHDTRPLDDALLETGLPDSGTTPEQAGEMIDVRAALRRAIAALTPGQRTVLVLRDVYGWSTEEVSGALRISRTTAKVRLHRARKRVRELMTEGGA